MPSVAPVQKFEMDLNGTGVLVDVSAYVDDPSGVQVTTGRTDWTSAEPNAGTLSFTLTNYDGRFTPGSTLSYLVGVLSGVLVQWTIGTRVRRYRISMPSLLFPAGRYSQSMVTVSCVDALAILAAKTLRSMLEEATKVAFPPQGYWLLNDGSIGPPLIGCTDSSGAGQPLLIPTGNIAALSPTSGVGPATGGTGAMRFEQNSVGTVTKMCALYAATANLSAPLITYQLGGVQFGTNAQMGFSMFFTIDDIYGAAFTTTNYADGPFIILAQFDHPDQFQVLYRLADRQLFIGNQISGWIRKIAQDASGNQISPTVTPGVMHHLALSWNPDAVTTPYMNFATIFDGVSYPAVHGQILFTGYDTRPTTQVALGGGGIGGYFATNTTVPLTFDGQIGNFTSGAYTGTVNMYAVAMQGSISNFVMFGPDVAGATAGDPYKFPQLPAAGTGLYSIGVGIQNTTSDARFLQLGTYSGRSDISFAVRGTPQSDLLDFQLTRGQTMLTAICTALRGEDSAIESIATIGSETIQAWLTSTQRQVQPDIVIDIENDLNEVPTISFDQTGIAVTATAQSRAVSAVWTDKSAPARLAATTASVTCAQLTSAAVLQLAQYRTQEGRTSRPALSSIKIDTRTASSDLAAALLAVRPGMHIQVTIPAAARTVFGGYVSADAYVIGTAELHTMAANVFTINLQAASDALEAITDPQDSTTIALIDRMRADGPDAGFKIDGSFTTTTTVFSLLQASTVNDPGRWPMFSNDPTDYPMTVLLQGDTATEVCNITVAPAAATYNGVSTFSQSVTLVRGASPVTGSYGKPITLITSGVTAY